MLKITVELWPFGSEKGKKTIATAIIGNTGKGNREYGQYFYDLRGEDGHTVRMGYIGEFLRKYDIWFLLAGIMQFAYQDVADAWRDGRIIGKSKEKE